MHSLFHHISVVLCFVSVASGLTCHFNENVCYHADVYSGCMDYSIHFKSESFHLTCPNGLAFDEKTAKCMDPSEFQCDKIEFSDGTILERWLSPIWNITETWRWASPQM
ncbi:hypothetical protein CDAR_227881 [Caerostris darwini]|uniref:Chitin-binding type-2 domain-containing protein n=1 Tax=Caerostris darwini TaxID=1538125 RepID=A0AAV4PGM8_9ARAC|nr:hypothetical protein CDAR_227881 [Caerostris darwini]